MPNVANREQRRYLLSVLRSKEDPQAFLVEQQDYSIVKGPTGREGIQIVAACDDDIEVDVTWVAIDSLCEMINRNPAPSEGDQFLPEDATHAWRWSADREAWYPEVEVCVECGGVHLPLLDEEAMFVVVGDQGKQT